MKRIFVLFAMLVATPVAAFDIPGLGDSYWPGTDKSVCNDPFCGVYGDYNQPKRLKKPIVNCNSNRLSVSEWEACNGEVFKPRGNGHSTRGRSNTK